MAGLDYDLIVLPLIEEHEFVLAHLHLIPGAHEQVVYQRGIRLVYVQLITAVGVSVPENEARVRKLYAAFPNIVRPVPESA